MCLRLVSCLRKQRDLTRTIVHVDMDMFYAAVEMRDNPALAGVPMAVGGMGMLSTSNYAARKFGVRAAMPGFIAKKLCPELVIVPGNMEKYAGVSEVVRGVFREYDPNFAPMSLDEAYLDITELVAREAEVSTECEVSTAGRLVQEMRAKIQERTQLTASAGIAPNCFLAKVCSDLNKPNGQFELRPNAEDIMKFVSTLNIRKVGGIGNVQEQLLKGIGVQTCRDLFEKRAEIRLLFSELSSEFYLEVSQGIGSSRIEPPEERERKSISTETTFSETSDRAALLDILTQLCRDLASDCREKGISGQAVTVKIKSHDFKTKTRVSQLCDFSNDEDLIHATARKILINLLDSSEEQPLALRLMGVRLSGLQDKEAAATKPRQRNILAFVRDAAAAGPSSGQAEEDRGEAQFPCPVCGEITENLQQLNHHIDGCLQQDGDTATFNKEKPILVSDKSDAKCTIPLKIAYVNNDIDAEKEKSGTETFSARQEAKGFFQMKLQDLNNPDTESTIYSIKNQSFEDNFCPDVETETMLPNLEENDDKKAYSDNVEPLPTFTCPVCFKSKFTEEQMLGVHVEECLSRQAISALLSSERSTSSSINNNKDNPKKRKIQDKTKRIDKKCKSDQSNKIDLFFKVKSS